jgi:hypothetical protein
VRHERVTAAEAEGAYTTVAVYWSLLAARSTKHCQNVRTRAAWCVLGTVAVLGALCAGESSAGKSCGGKGRGECASNHVGCGFRSVEMSCKGAKCGVQLSKAPRPSERPKRAVAVGVARRSFQGASLKQAGTICGGFRVWERSAR